MLGTLVCVIHIFVKGTISNVVHENTSLMRWEKISLCHKQNKKKSLLNKPQILQIMQFGFSRTWKPLTKIRNFIEKNGRLFCAYTSAVPSIMRIKISYYSHVFAGLAAMKEYGVSSLISTKDFELILLPALRSWKHFLSPRQTVYAMEGRMCLTKHNTITRLK